MLYKKKKKWNWKKNLFWYFVEPSYSSLLEDFVENGVYSLFLVIEKDKQYIVSMKKGVMKVIELKTLFTSNKIIVDDIIYKKLYCIK